MSDSGTKCSGKEETGNQPREESQEGPASTSPSPNRSSNSNNRPIKKRNHSTIDDARSSRLDELEAAESLVTVSTAAVVSASASASAPPAPKRLKGDNNKNSKGGVMEGDNSNDDEDDEEEDHSNDEEDEDSSSEQSEGAATTSSLSGSDDCVETKGDNTTKCASSSSGGGGSTKKAKKAGLRKGKWTVSYFSILLSCRLRSSFCLALLNLCLVQATPIFRNSPHPLFVHKYITCTTSYHPHNSPRKRPIVPLSSDTFERAYSAFRMA